MKSLQDQLEASRHKELSLDDSLTSTTESLKHVQDLTEKHLELKEEELAQLKSELSGLEEKHVKLEEAMVESLQNVDRLERAHRRAQEESQQLREELEEEQRENGRKWESMNEDKEKIQRKVCFDDLEETLPDTNLTLIPWNKHTQGELFLFVLKCCVVEEHGGRAGVSSETGRAIQGQLRNSPTASHQESRRSQKTESSPPLQRNRIISNTDCPPSGSWSGGHDLVMWNHVTIM